MAAGMIKHRREVITGLASTGAHVKVVDDTFSLQSEFMTMNEQMAETIEATGIDHHRWNSIQIYKITSSRDVLDNLSLGCVINVIVGRDSDGPFRARGKKGTLYGCIITSNAADTFRCHSGTFPWLLVRSARLPKEDHLDGNDRDYLQQLVFLMGNDNLQSAETEERTFLHCCCEEGNILSSPIKRKQD
jgi:hypothetical protein